MFIKCTFAHTEELIGWLDKSLCCNNNNNNNNNKTRRKKKKEKKYENSIELKCYIERKLQIFC